MLEYPKTIEEAAEGLDSTITGWADKINIPILFMTSDYLCVLGQIFGRYRVGMMKLFNIDTQREWLEPSSSYTVDDIFGIKADTKKWTALIRERQHHSVM